jgi:ABC-type transporter Mla subunit MlaD
MSVATTNAKLGLFTLLAAAAIVLAGIVLGIRLVHQDVVEYQTFFDESVDGLSVGAPVMYRGVRIGNVDRIGVAPDNRLVAVSLGIIPAEERRLGLRSPPAGLRAQLATQGITGVKIVDIDFFDPEKKPPPMLPFREPDRYIPSTTSTFKTLQDALENLGEHLPQIADAAVGALQKLEVIASDIHDAQVAAKLGQTVGDIDQAVNDLRGFVRHVDRANVPEKVAKAVDGLTETVAHANAMLERIGGDGGLVASAAGATDAIGEFGRTASGSALELEHTLRELREAAKAIRQLATELERDPEMLIRGRAKGSK